MARCPEPKTGGDMSSSEATTPSVDELARLLQICEGKVEAARLAVTELELNAREAQQAADLSRLPHGRAWLVLVSGRYGSDRGTARRTADSASAAYVAGKKRLSAAEEKERRAGEECTHTQEQAAAANAMVVAAAIGGVLAGPDPAAAQMAVHLQVVRTCDAELTEVAEAIGAVAAARQAANVAAHELDKAHSWGTYDTWFGGGMLSSSIKHDRIDSTNNAMAKVQSALISARKELADVAVELAVPDLSRVGAHRTMDVWFDNIFSDLGTQSRIKDGQAAVQRLRTELVQVNARLDGLRDQLSRRRRDAAADRDALIAPLLAQS